MGFTKSRKRDLFHSINPNILGPLAIYTILFYMCFESHFAYMSAFLEKKGDI